MDFSNLIQTVAIYALPVIFAITLHEAAHGYVARYFGDNTAWMLGRVTLNPMKHIDPVGTIAMPLLLYIATAGSFLFGYAKPVPVSFGNLRNPKRDMIWVALAGPVVNLVQAVFWTMLGALLLNTGMGERFFLLMCRAGILANLAMFAFNMVPLPPLDGGRVLVGLLPRNAAMSFSRVERYGILIVAALLILPSVTENKFPSVISTYWMLPIMRTTVELIGVPFPSVATLLTLR
ncbi:MAG: site-2 protease family protein [Burkholderiales bacterium]|nr:MAG: site-2 protease family protein [Burkholderiales bacterium]